MTEHVHGYIRFRVRHPLLALVALKLGLGRLVIKSGTLPCGPECDPASGTHFLNSETSWR